MSIVGMAAGSGLAFVVAIGLLGTALGVLAERLIARALPRLGSAPSVRSRITTAALTGVLSAALALRLGMDGSLPAFLVLAVLGVQLARIDLAHHLLPNPLVLALLIGGLALFAAGSSASAGWPHLLRAAASAVILFVVYLILAVISPRGIGMGDVKLAAPVGLYLGYLGWGQLFYGGALAFILGGIFSVVLISFKRAKKPAEVAYGPAMLAATLGMVLITP
ncbi:prepilin peptidase [Arthrobacter sp. NPDC093139]|uniref:prepilin peptidase n=1 Tax=Arthrobacter sp. NPDC093139 TaxID=3363945 RepID=UPI0037F4B0E2